MSEELLQRVGDLWGRGFSVIPILERGKKPAIAWADYQRRTPTMDEIGDWFHNGRAFNIGIVTGAVSGVVAVDFDSPETLAWGTAHLPLTPMRTKTAKGEHWFYRHPGVAVSNKARIRTADGRLAVDVRGDHGFVVAPGSIHETGAVYEKLGTWPAVDSLPTFDPAWIAAPPVPSVERSSPVFTDDRDQLLRRARAYVANVPPAVAGQGGDAHTFQLACKLVRGFGLSESDSFELLQDWNHGCVPPWTDRELDEKISGAGKYGTEPMGGRAAERRQGSATPLPAENTALPKIVVQAESILPFHTAAELSREQPAAPAWCAYGLLARGVITELAGKLKASGKTTFVGQLVRSLLDGNPFLGHETQQTAVVWLTEERPTTFLETLKRAHLETRTDLHILHWHDVKGLSFPVVIADAIAKCQAAGAVVLIIDTISQFAGMQGESENNAGDALAAIAPLQAAAAAGLAVLVPRHERKGGGEVGESGRGSSAFSGAVDIVVAIRRAEGQTRPTVRVLHCLSRFSETPDTLVIDLTADGYVALGTEGTVATIEAGRVLLDRLPCGPDAAVSLDDALKDVTPRISRTAAQNAVAALMSRGVVLRLGKGKRGDGYRYFRTVDLSA